MASDLEKLADSVRALGDSGSPFLEVVSAAAKSASHLANKIPDAKGVQGVKAVHAGLQAAQAGARAATSDLEEFNRSASAFAARLAKGGGSSGWEKAGKFGIAAIGTANVVAHAALNPPFPNQSRYQPAPTPEQGHELRIERPAPKGAVGWARSWYQDRDADMEAAGISDDHEKLNDVQKNSNEETKWKGPPKDPPYGDHGSPPPK